MERLLFHYVLHVGFFPSRTHLHLEGRRIEMIKNKNKKLLSKEKLMTIFFKKQ